MKIVSIILVILAFLFIHSISHASWQNPTWSGPIFQQSWLIQDDYYEFGWSNQPTGYQCRIDAQIYYLNGTYVLTRDFRVRGAMDGRGTTQTYGFSPVTWSALISWTGSGNPTYKNFSESIGGALGVQGSAYYDWAGLQDGYSYARNDTGVGVQILGSVTGNTDGLGQSSSASLGIDLKNQNESYTYESGGAWNINANIFPPALGCTASFTWETVTPPQTYDQKSPIVE